MSKFDHGIEVGVGNNNYTVADEDGTLYQNGTKIDLTAAAINGVATQTGTETLTNKTITSPVVTDPDISYTGAATLTYNNGHADKTLSATEKKNFFINANSADASANLIFPADRRFYLVYNGIGNGFVLTCKVTGQTGVKLKNGARELLYCNGTDIYKANATLTQPTLYGFALNALTGIDLSAADVTLTDNNILSSIIVITTGHATNAIIAPSDVTGRSFIIRNTDGSNAVLIKKAAGTAVTIAAGKTALVYYDGTNYQLALVGA